MLRKLTRNFNRAAVCYDQAAQVQHQVGAQLIAMLSSRQLQFQRVIDLGCGTGLTSERLVKHCHPQQFTAIDIAAELIFLAEKRLASYNVKLDIQDFHRFAYTEPFDLIFSNMALQWSDNLPGLFEHCYSNLTEGGYFTFTMPVQNSFKNLHACHKFELPSLASITKTLTAVGYRSLVSEQQSHCLEYPSVMNAMKAIKAIGANTTRQTRNTMQGKRYLQNIKERSPQTAQATFMLNYEIAYILVQK